MIISCINYTSIYICFNVSSIKAILLYKQETE